MKVRRLPVVLEAEQFLPEELPLPFDKQQVCCYDGQRWYVQALEGPLTISVGDWIIKGAKGEYYPCKPEVFNLTYESVETVEAL